MAELFDLRNGYTPSKSQPEYWVNGDVPWFRMEDIRENGRLLDHALQTITPQAVKGGRLFARNSIIIATSATIGEHALVTVPFLANQRFTCLTVKPEYANQLNMKFAFHYCFLLGEWCRLNTTTSSFAGVDMPKFRSFKFPVPSFDAQERIVKVLDQFDSLVNDLSIGLPAELAARRKQYEYYRARLLAFEEAVA